MLPMLPPLSTSWVFDENHDPPAFTRPLVGSELAMHRIWSASDGDGEVHIGVNFTSSSRMDELKACARGALDKLRFVCPLIACTVEDVMRPRWIYVPSADREAWLDLALVVEPQIASLDPSVRIRSMNRQRLPYTDRHGSTTFFRMYLLATSNEGDDKRKNYGLYFHASHSIMDAAPAFYALNLMCQWMSGEGMDVRIEPSEEWKNLPVDPVTATGGPSSAWDTAGMMLLQEYVAQNDRTTPCHTLAAPSPPFDLNTPFQHIITLSESETAAIVATTKSLGIPVSALFYAAHCLAQLKMNPIPEGDTDVDFSTSSITISLERYMKPPVDPRTHLVSSSTLMPSRFSMAGPLKERTDRARLIATAKLLQESLDRHLANPCLPDLYAVLANMMPIEFQPDTDAKEEDRGETTDAPSVPWGSSFQNLGVVEQKLQLGHGNVSVERVCIASLFKTVLNVHMWTMRSKFHFQVQGTMAWGEKCMTAFLEEMIRVGLLVLDDR